jgi:hypothetical protein
MAVHGRLGPGIQFGRRRPDDSDADKVAAIDTCWAEEAYLKDRFRATLGSFIPCFQ